MLLHPGLAGRFRDKVHLRPQYCFDPVSYRDKGKAADLRLWCEPCSQIDVGLRAFLTARVEPNRDSWATPS